MFSIYDGRSEFYQWDLDRKLIVNDKTIKQVHFCNRTDSCSLIRYPYEVNGVYLVDVPNVILQSDFRINVYGYDANYTKHSDKFEVIRSSKPENYVYTDEEVKCFEEATEMAAEAKAAAVAAEAKADEAYANAETAKAETAKLAFSLGNLYMDEKQGETVAINDMRGSVQELVSYIDGYAKPGNPNILPVDLSVESNWNYNADVGDYYYIIPNLAAGTYTLYYESMVGEMIWCDGVEMFSHTPHTFTLTETKNVRLASWGMVEYIKLEEGTKHTDEVVLANLIPDDLSKASNWRYYDEVGLYAYTLSDLPAGTYTIYSDGDSDLEIDEPSSYFTLEPKTPYTFTANRKGSIEIRDWSSGGGIAAIKLERGTKFTGFANSNPNLIPPEYASGQMMWPYYEELGGCVLVLENIPEGTYTLYQKNDWADYLYIQEGSGDEFSVNYEEPYTFYHYGGNISIFDYSGGAIYQLVKLEKGSEYTGTNYYTYDTEFNKVELTVNDTVYTAEISPTVYGSYDWLKGQLNIDGKIEFYEPQAIEVKNKSTLSSSTGETYIVYGRDLTSVIEELQYAIISLGGNV